LTPTVSAALAQSGLVPLDAKVLLAHVVGRDRAWLVAHGADALAREHWDAFMALARRRQDGEPVAYLTGMREFWGLRLRVTPEVLIPRPETETLVEVALARLPIDREVRVLDLGTGSGAIALAIAHARPRAHVLATDISSDALDVARDNANALGLRNVEFLKSDWYDGVARDRHGGAFHLIASNPPYIAAADPHLDEGDVRFEPERSLSPGGDGLGAIRKIVAGASERLMAGGTLAVEHGYDQSEAVRTLFVDAGFEQVIAMCDLAQIPRTVAGALPSRTGAAGPRLSLLG
jgi:release factor glutamine methyltransferase